ncbi:MAG: hypothetical protein NW214_06920 [Pseudanabaenaceae cyanobacterium bins.39]|nr:hypothetical protein [Pseudanabaenaceae cyanobacterium bins.39]
MPTQEVKARTFKGMSYREVQISNTQSRKKLSKSDQQWLKDAGYKNMGWEAVISLYQKIASLQNDHALLEDMSLGDLFLEADRIGNKYQTAKEITEYQQQLREADQFINEQIDQYFVDTDVEVIDFSKNQPQKQR